MADIENALERNRQYWKKRFSAVEAMNHNRAEKAVDKITPAFDRAQKQIQKEIESWYHRFADNNEISLAEAKRLLKGKDLDELKWDIDEYIKRGKEYGISGAWAKELENASARYHISRLEALQLRCQQAAEEAFGNELDELDDFLSKACTEGYYHTAFEIQKGLGIGYDIGTIDKNKVRRVLEKPWTADGKTFSDRIWTSKTQLLDSVDKELTQMCILGKAPDQAIENIAKRMNVSKNQAGRLVMTESAYIASAAQKDCFNDLDVEEYEIVATLDGHTSEICREMDGKHFPMKDFQPDVTAPPFHVWCRSCTCPYFDDEFTENETRAARGEDGKTYQVPADMKYPEWKKAFVDGDKSGFEEGINPLSGMTEYKWQKASVDNRTKDLKNDINHGNVEKRMRNIDTGGKRNDVPLSESQINDAIASARRQGYDGDIQYGQDSFTSFHGSTEGEKYHYLVIGTDAYPSSSNSSSANSKISLDGCMAHEVIGHYETWMKGTALSDIVLDEAQASIRASKFGYDLSDYDRQMLMEDAMERLNDAGYVFDDIKNLLDIMER